MMLRFLKYISPIQQACTVVRWYSPRSAVGGAADSVGADAGSPIAATVRRGRRTRARSTAASAAKAVQPPEPVEAKPPKRFHILRPDDKMLSSLLLKVKSRKTREKNDCILLEGKNMIREALMNNLEPVAIFFNHTDLIKDLTMVDPTKLYKTTYQSIQLWSNLTNSQGILGVFKTPDVSNKEPSENSIPLTFVLDNIRDPGNLGSILRSAAGIGCEKFIIVRKGCVDLWEPKVLRSACGAHFRVPIYSPMSWEEVPRMLPDNCAIYIADSNPAGKKVCRKESNVFLSSLPLLPWNEVDYTTREVVIVVTGETVALSPEASKVLETGYRIHIPLCNSVDSLNAGVAISVIGFEVRRQFMAKSDLFAPKIMQQ